MRITLVSAHFPPNFVSGGTLQPQRLARGLRARGHDVRVVAGFVDLAVLDAGGGADLRDEPGDPVDAWDEIDETGLPVHWVASTPWLDWADTRNYDNPKAAAHLAEHLDRHPADVVHLHALQGLGAGLVEVAKASGAATVVTMHDFWWTCARQFLVDRELRPCSLVVAAGDCACEDGRAHLDERAARLRAYLHAADLVLAPSRSAATVLEANGIDPARLRVDENGMDQPVPGRPGPGARSLPSAGAPVVVRYTGRSNPMKGADVLLDAVHALGAEPGLRLIAHDLDKAVERDGRPIEGTCLELAPPYAPEALDDLLAVTDVLLLPSVMRESHSLVTREALLRGVPVITTDTIGPEEVVADGVNGLVVPAGDADLLRAALRAVTDRATLATLTAGASVPPPVRSLEDQLDGLERHYRDLTAAPPAVGGWRPGRVLFVVGIEGAPLRYRARLPAEALALHGVHSDTVHYRDPSVERRAAAADVIIVYRVPATPQVLTMLDRERARGAVAIFDVDDLIFDPDLAAEIPALRLLPSDEAALWLEGVRRYRTTMEHCDAYIGSTPRLVDHARSVVGIDAHLFENGVGAALGAASDIALRRPRRHGPLRVGYFSGTTTHDDDWRHVEEAVVGAIAEHRDAELWLGGHLQPTEAVLRRLPGRVRRLPFQPWHDLPGLLRDLDVNLAPLEPGSRFNDAKSAIKWLEAALVATPTIASPSAPFTAVLADGRTGWLADQPEEWAAAVRVALADHDGRALAGARARRQALLEWSPHRQAHRYLAILDQVATSASSRRREPSPTWTEVANDEPLLTSPVPLEPYPPELRGSTKATRRAVPRSPLAQWARQKAARVRDTLREGGLGGPLRGLGRWMGRRLGRGPA